MEPVGSPVWIPACAGMTDGFLGGAALGVAALGVAALGVAALGLVALGRWHWGGGAGMRFRHAFLPVILFSASSPRRRGSRGSGVCDGGGGFAFMGPPCAGMTDVFWRGPYRGGGSGVGGGVRRGRVDLRGAAGGVDSGFRPCG